MKKILFALDGNHFSPTAFEFIRRLNEKDPVVVTGVYIPAFVNDLVWALPSEEDAFSVPRLLEEDEEMIRGNIQGFKDACIANQIEFRVHGDVGYSILEGLEKETRFADLFVIGYEGFYKDSTGEYVQEKLRGIVETAECPVLLVPEKAAFPENVIIAYDGGASSVYAMKMFSYLFASFRDAETLIVYAELNGTDLPSEDYVKELAAPHFNNLVFSSIDLEPRRYFTTWLRERPASMLVTGAYGRSELSQLFRKSFVAGVLEDNSLPVFIAHA
jgi:nucleotide-binding universal stress UspA family protein